MIVYAPHRRVCISALRIDAPVGVYDYERAAPQPLIIDVTLTAPRDAPPAALDDAAAHIPPAAAERPELRSIVCYDTLAQKITALVQERHTDFLETLADSVAALCLADSRVVAVEVRLCKPQAIADADAACVVVTASRG